MGEAIMKMPIAEVTDRYTILKIKEAEGELDVGVDLAEYEKEVISHNVDPAFLSAINKTIWDVENVITEELNRQPAPNLGCVGALYHVLRILNLQRCNEKNVIAVDNHEPQDTKTY